MNEMKLIALYFYVSERYEKELKYLVQRYSPNGSEPEFTDAEVLTVYLFVMSEERRFLIKEIHDFATRYLRSWFPQLPSYQAFDHRVGCLWEVLQGLVRQWLVLFMPLECSSQFCVVDSLPVMTCRGKRDGRVASEIADKGYCSTKGVYYYGVKLHVLGLQRPGHLPWIDRLVCSPASQSDLTVYKENWESLTGRTVLGDKVYKDLPFFGYVQRHYHTVMLIPVKAQQGKPECLRRWDKALEDLFSHAVCRMRQPIESLFNWLIQKADIQNASHVRSTKGLLLHVFGRLAAALLSVIW